MSEYKEHADQSPSTAHQWLICALSVLAQKNIPNESSTYSEEGTAAHEYAALWLITGVPPQLPWKAKNGFEFSNDPDESGDQMGAIRVYVNKVLELKADGKIFVEQRTPIEFLTGEKGACGTTDVFIVSKDGKTVYVIDFKFGQGVRVDADNNPQIQMYILGVLNQFEVVLDEVENIYGVIIQSRLGHYSECKYSKEDLDVFADEVKFKSNFIQRTLRGEVKIIPEQDYVPGEKQCRFCRAKSICPALAEHTLKITADDFVSLDSKPKFDNALAKIETIDNTKLAWFMQNLGLIEDWIGAVRARAEIELFAGHDVPGFKLVQGKKGNRKWEDEKLVEQTMKDWRMKTDDIYKMKVISPADAEKAFKEQPKRWAKLQELITQNEGKPSVAPSTDPRPALELGAREDDFDVIEG